MFNNAFQPVYMGHKKFDWWFYDFNYLIYFQVSPPRSDRKTSNEKKNLGRKIYTKKK